MYTIIVYLSRMSESCFSDRKPRT